MLNGQSEHHSPTFHLRVSQPVSFFPSLNYWLPNICLDSWPGCLRMLRVIAEAYAEPVERYRPRRDESDRTKGLCSNKLECKRAMHGREVPKWHKNGFLRICIIRGIRHHPGFAQELYGLFPMFNRALNARRIMSNEIPEMTHPEDFPYCIWHPEVASEVTYCELARRYPQMKYLVGRACAVAGYRELLAGLDLLPEIHIAEEARDNGHDLIFQDVMSHDPLLYEVMDDYKRHLCEESPRSAAVLNGDTAVLSSLKWRTKIKFYNDKVCSYQDLSSFHECIDFNITEDCQIDTRGFGYSTWRTDVDVTTLLYTPLPKHLPNINKNVLICMAAWNGDVDRYVRLRRPHPIPREDMCLFRGIYHHPAFAKWCSQQSNFFGGRSDIQDAITARFIMSGNLTRLKPEGRWDPHNIIWWPQLASPETYEALADNFHYMKEFAARAMIIGDYQLSFELVDPVPTLGLMIEAQDSSNPFYKEFLTNKASAEGIEIDMDVSFPQQKLGLGSYPIRHLQFAVHSRCQADALEPEKKFVTARDIAWDDGDYAVGMLDVGVGLIERNMLLEQEQKRDEPSWPSGPGPEPYETDSDSEN